MPKLSTQSPKSTGTAIAWTNSAASTTYTYDNSGSTQLLVWHNDGASVAVDNIVTIVTPATLDGLALADRSITLTPGTIHVVGKLKRETYNSGSEVSFTVAGTDVGIKIKFAVVEA